MMVNQALNHVQQDIDELHDAGIISEMLKITAASTLSAIAYGLIHDQLAVRHCFEYYKTEPHLLPIPINSPTIYGLVWGIISTWWVGAGLGITTSMFAQLGPWPKVFYKELFPQIATMVGGVATTSALTGVSSWLYMNSRNIDPEWVQDRQYGELLYTPDIRRNWLTVGVSNEAGYAAGVIGGVMLWVYTINKRYQKSLKQNNALTL